MTQRHSTDDPRWDRLIHLVAGELSADEASALQSWIDADPERQRVVAHLQGVWCATEPSGNARPDAWDAEAELRRIRSETGGAGRVIARVGPRFEHHSISGRRSRIAVLLRIAAVTTLVVGGGFLWRLRAPAPADTTIAARAMAEYRTAPGQRLSLGLPDGTRVMLAPGSVLRRAMSYGVRDRNVYLDGEADFHVTHDAARPFTVRTARAVARDLGTRFVVRAYSDEATTDVVVSEGMVAVSGTRPRSSNERAVNDGLVLRAGQRASITTEGSLTHFDAVALEPYFGWTAGQLVFERAPLGEVVRQLRRWYGVDVRLADANLQHYRLTATLREENAAEALDLVATSLRLSVALVGRTYVFTQATR